MQDAQLIEARLWQKLQKTYNLSDEIAEKLQKYYELLFEANKNFNLIGYKTFQEALINLFEDSLQATGLIDFSQISSFADVGTGGGFPGLLLAILFPEKKAFLIEVNQKKIKFLRATAEALGLNNVLVIAQDWRTFCRKTDLPIDLFFTKAAIDEDEICRMFRSYCPYRSKNMVYFASTLWQCMPKLEKYVKKTLGYQLRGKERRLIIFGDTSETQAKDS